MEPHKGRRAEHRARALLDRVVLPYAYGAMNLNP